MWRFTRWQRLVVNLEAKENKDSRQGERKKTSKNMDRNMIESNTNFFFFTQQFLRRKKTMTKMTTLTTTPTTPTTTTTKRPQEPCKKPNRIGRGTKTRRHGSSLRILSLTPSTSRNRTTKMNGNDTTSQAPLTPQPPGTQSQADYSICLDQHDNVRQSRSVNRCCARLDAPREAGVTYRQLRR